LEPENLAPQRRHNLNKFYVPTESHRLSARKAAKPHPKRQLTKPSKATNGSGAFYSRFTIHFLLLQLIGSDRSAFTASRHRGGWAIKN